MGSQAYTIISGRTDDQNRASVISAVPFGTEADIVLKPFDPQDVLQIWRLESVAGTPFTLMRNVGLKQKFFSASNSEHDVVLCKSLELGPHAFFNRFVVRLCSTGQGYVTINNYADRLVATANGNDHAMLLKPLPGDANAQCLFFPRDVG